MAAKILFQREIPKKGSRNHKVSLKETPNFYSAVKAIQEGTVWMWNNCYIQNKFQSRKDNITKKSNYLKYMPHQKDMKTTLLEEVFRKFLIQKSVF